VLFKRAGIKENRWPQYLSDYAACAVPPPTSPRAEDKDCLSAPAATTAGLLSQIGKKRMNFLFKKKN